MEWLLPDRTRHCFPSLVIQHADWLYHRFTLSFCDVEDLLAERGIGVSYETFQWNALDTWRAVGRSLNSAFSVYGACRRWLT